MIPRPLKRVLWFLRPLVWLAMATGYIWLVHLEVVLHLSVSNSYRDWENSVGACVVIVILGMIGTVAVMSVRDRWRESRERYR